MKKDTFSRLFPLAGYIPFVLFFLVPVGTVLTGTDLYSIKTVFTDPYFLHITGFTLFQALASTAASLLLGLPGAWIMANRSFCGKKLIRSLWSVPFVLPSILAVLGFVIFYGNSGYLNRFLMLVFNLKAPPLRLLYTFGAVILAHAFFNFGVVVSVVGSSWQSLDHSCEESARSLGATERQVFARVTLPLLLPSVLSAASLVFLYCFTSFAVILVLGGGPALTTIEVEIYRQARISLDTQQAAALSLVSLAVACTVLFIHSFFQKKAAANSSPHPGPAQTLRPAGHWSRAYIVLSVLFCILPVLSIIFHSFTGSTSRGGRTVFSFNAYIQLFRNLKPLLNTALTAFCAAVLGLVYALGLCYGISGSKRGGIKDTAVMLPMAVSSVILGLSYFLISRYLSFISPLVLLILVHSVIVMPFAVRTLLPVMRAIPVSFKELASLDGASGGRIFTGVLLPLLKKPLMTSFAFCFAISTGELNSTILLGGTNIPTLPVQIYRLITSYNYQGACAAGTLLILTCFGVFLSSHF